MYNVFQFLVDAVQLLVGIGENTAQVGCAIFARDFRKGVFQRALWCLGKGISHFGFGNLCGFVQAVATFFARINLHGLTFALRCGGAESLSQGGRTLTQFAQRALDVGRF